MNAKEHFNKRMREKLTKPIDKMFRLGYTSNGEVQQYAVVFQGEELSFIS